MKKIISILVLIFLSMSKILAYEIATQGIGKLNLNTNLCTNINQTNIPTIFIPGILASWYSEQGLGKFNSKKWIPDPVTHVYDTLFKVFQSEGGYTLRDVYYNGDFNLSIKGNPKRSLYLFGYDWKKDNKITAKLLRDLILQIRLQYEEVNGCDIGSVNIIGHSMGGLVARSMFENMCANDYDLNNYYRNIKKGKIKKINSNNCYNYTKINKFITISTPQRGSPGGFALWEKGDLEVTTRLGQSFGLRAQLGAYTNESLFETIHGFEDKIPNGIITIGQLLPDIKNNNKYNDKLKYLYKNNKLLNNYNYPQNSFLEELNKKENIEKMFEGISGQYSMYYSKQTGSDEKNNIIGYDIQNKYSQGIYGIKSKDKTEKYKGQDIYDKYNEIFGVGGIEIKKSYYNINNTIRNNTGLGGDGTVPSKNLILIANDDIKEIKKSDKFETIVSNCSNDKGNDENQLVKKLGKIENELCSHTKMPILNAIKILEKISGFKLTQKITEQQLLYKYIGYADRSITNGYNGGEEFLNADNLFKKKYVYLFKNDKNGTKEENINRFINTKNDKKTKRISLGFTSGIQELLRYEVLSPINIIIEDEQGRKIGIDPETGLIINEIPGAWTSGNTEGSGEP